MLALVLHALRARRAQSLAIFALTLLAGLGAAAAPWFLVWSSDAVARATIALAPTSERIAVASATLPHEVGAPSPIQVLRDQMAQSLTVPGAQTQVGARELASFSAASTSEKVGAYLVYRDEVCDHIDLTAGACPGDRDGVLISDSVARQLGLGVGDPLIVDAASSKTTLPVSGVYRVTDPYDVYWSGTKLLAVLGETSTADPVFVTEQTLLELPLGGLDVDAHVVLPDSVFTDPHFDLAGRLNQAAAELHQRRIALATTATNLRVRVFDHWSLLMLGVGIAATQLVLVCWVGLFLAVRHTAEDRRADIGLLKLRGISTLRVWTLVTLRSGLPALAGTLLGAVAGFAIAAGLTLVGGGSPSAGLTGAAPGGLSTWDMVGLSVAAAAVAGLGLAAAVVAEWRSLGTPALDLLRRVPARARGWRADVAELVLVVLAGACVYQARAESGTGIAASALALLAPSLVAIAVAVLVARALPPAAARAGAWGLRAGRAGVALAALHLARRRGTHRVFAVLAVAAAIFTTTTTVWHSASTAWQQRAVLELGAGRVLTVDASSPAALLAAVRAVDPEGRYAMAVAGSLGRLPEDRLLAVDTTRLARVGQLPDGQPSPAQLAALLRPAAASPPMLLDGPVTLDVATLDVAPLDVAPLEPTAPPALRLHLSTLDGIVRQVDFPIAETGRRTVAATVEGCAGGCRLVALQVIGAPATVEIYGLSQGDGLVLSGPVLGDVSRWRTTLTYPAAPPEISPHDGRLVITQRSVPDPSAVNGWVVPLTAPVPLPVVVAGPPPERHGAEARVAVLGGTPVPFRVVASLPVLPQMGDGGMLVDLEYALRSNDKPSAATGLWVWMTTDAPETLVAALGEHGVTVRGDVSTAGRAGDLAADAPGLALLFGYLVAAVLLLLGAGVAFVNSTVESSSRVAELVALRGQGLPTRAVRWAGLAGPALLVAAATVTGVLAALLAQVLVTAELPVFSDDWGLLPTPTGLTGATLAISVAVVVAVLATASVSGAVALVSAVRAHTGRDGEQ